MGNQYMGNPYMGNPCMGNPYMGNPYMGNPCMGNPCMGNPYNLAVKGLLKQRNPSQKQSNLIMIAHISIMGYETIDSSEIGVTDYR